MGACTQDRRTMRVTVPAMEANQLLLVGFTGQEAVSELFEFDLDVRVDRNASFEFDELLGKDIRVDVHSPNDEVLRRFHGIVGEIGETDVDADFIHLSIEMVPRLWLLSQTLRSRIFQDKTVVEIVGKILTEHSIAHEFKLADEYPPRHYTTQYQESDLDFVSRLLEEHGIAYYFQHEESGHRVILDDQSQSATPILHGKAIEHRASAGGTANSYRISSWKPTVRLRPGKFMLRDHNFQLPGKHLEARDSLATTIDAGDKKRRLAGSANQNLLQFEYPGDYAKLFDVAKNGSIDSLVAEQRDRTVKIRAQEQACRGIEIVGKSDCPALIPGSQFKLAGHPHANDDYFITRVEQRIRMPEYRSTDDPAVPFECIFRCQPAALPYRPTRDTASPVIQSAQTATVVGATAKDGDVAVDSYGRVKVHFHWDPDGKSDGNDSCWIRVASPWAGQGWGMVSYPRIGQEVVVAFLEGDPDRPLVIGSVYNPAQPTPFAVPDRRNEMCIKSRTIGGGPNDFHGLSFNDARGSELLRMRSQKDMLVEVKNNQQIAIPRAHSSIVGSVSYTQVGALIATHSAPGGHTGNEHGASGHEGSSGGQHGGSIGGSHSGTEHGSPSSGSPPGGAATSEASGGGHGGSAGATHGATTGGQHGGSAAGHGSGGHSDTHEKIEKLQEQIDEIKADMNWAGVKIEAGYGLKVGGSYGSQIECTVGSTSEVSVGVSHGISIQPLILMGPASLVSTPVALGMAGKSEVGYGGESGLSYGYKFEAGHGSSQERTGELEGNATPIALVAVMHGLSGMTKAFMPGLTELWDVSGWHKATILTELVESLLLALLIHAEDLLAKVEDAEEEAEHLKHEIKSAKKAAKKSLDRGLANAKAIAQLSASCVKWAAGANADDRKMVVKGSMEQEVKKVFSITADQGVVINTPDAIDITSGMGCRFSSSDGNTSLWLSSFFGIEASFAPMGPVERLFKMNAKGITMALEPEGSFMKMKSLGTTIKAPMITLEDETGQNSISIGPAGVKINGVTVNTAALTRNAAHGPMQPMTPS